MIEENSEVYGVGNKIEAMNLDFFNTPSNIEVDCVFMSPPWGGIDYTSQDYYSLFT